MKSVMAVHRRLESILDQVVSRGAGTQVSGYDYVYDASSNLLEELYTKQSRAVGDHFVPDDFNRLKTAECGVPSSGCGSPDVLVDYHLDDAQSCESVTAIPFSGAARTESYALASATKRLLS